MKYERHFPDADRPYETRTVRRQGEESPVEFRVPADWSPNAASTFASHYARVVPAKGREGSAAEAIDRVAGAISAWVGNAGYFGSARRVFGRKEDVEQYADPRPETAAFRGDLRELLASQRATFNSPVWYNLGLSEKPQASACYIQSVEDTMESIVGLQASETRLFKRGSGTGTNFSTLRPRGFPLSVGGSASGPCSFMRGFDAWAGVVRSGGECLAPGQMVYTSSGPVAVSELADRGSFVCVSYDPPAGRYKMKLAQAWLSGRKKTVAVVTDKGRFEVSHDHPFRLSTGDSCRAEDLAAGFSLFACSISTHLGYVYVSLRDGHGTKETMHRMVAADVLHRDLAGMSVHHLDEDKTNNDPENLRVMTQAEHAGQHGKELVASGNHPFQRQDWGKPGAANGMHSGSDFWADSGRSDAYRELQGQILKDSGRAQKMQDAAARQRMLNTAYRIMCAGYSIDDFNLYTTGRINAIGRFDPRKVRAQIDARFGSYENFLAEVRASNHRVVEVVPLGESDVYSVEVFCPTDDDKSAESGHTYVIWSGEERFGSGVVVFNTRRAAKMAILNVDHPDILTFIAEKAQVERLADDAVARGWPADWNGDLGRWLPFQNANHSVRVSDAFMRAVEAGATWELRWGGRAVRTVDARDLWARIAEAAHASGCPGVQFDDTINGWHTSPSGGRQCATNPCSEYSFIDDSACNLAHLNLRKFFAFGAGAPTFDVNAFRAAARCVLIAQDAIVGRASYPTEKIRENSLKYRPLGLGYAGLGSVIMALGLPYDSVEARDLAAALTSLLAAQAWLTSAEMARDLGRFDVAESDALATAAVLKRHVAASENLVGRLGVGRLGSEGWWDVLTRQIASAARGIWQAAQDAHAKHGARNAQLTLLAPTGTCGIAMDSDTTGCEPYFSPVAYKSLAGGGSIKTACAAAPDALRALGYAAGAAEEILAHVARHERFDDAPGLRPEHAAVFDCAVPGRGGSRSLSPESHVLMMAAIQPFLSGAISKTVNMPATATPDDVRRVYELAWKTGVKCIAVYVDGSKYSQPVTTGGKAAASERVIVDAAEPVRFAATADPAAVAAAIRELRRPAVQLDPGADGPLEIVPPTFSPTRERLPQDRRSHTRHFSIAGTDGYLTVGFYDDGRVGEVFCRLGKAGDTVGGLLDQWATLLSVALQHGVPLESLIAKGEGSSFSPSGFTGDDLRHAQSVIDYICRYLRRHLPGARNSPAQDAPAAPSVNPAKTLAWGAPRPTTGTAPPAPPLAAPPEAPTPLTPEEREELAALRANDRACEVAGHSPAAAKMRRLADLEARDREHASGPPCDSGSGCHGRMQRRGPCLQCSVCGHRSGCGG